MRLTILILAVSILGCQWASRNHGVRHDSEMFEELHVQYRIRSSTQQAVAQSSHRVHTVANHEVVHSPKVRTESDDCELLLRVDFPHPDCAAGHARASVRLSHRPQTVTVTGWSDRIADQWRSLTGAGSLDRDGMIQRNDEVWVLDIPRGEIDDLIARLGQEGLFETAYDSCGEAEIELELDRSYLSRHCPPSRGLDSLIHRVRSEGWINGFIESQPAVTGRNRPIPSDHATTTGQI